MTRLEVVCVPQRRLTALDGLRGVAALVVVVYHTLRLDEGFRHGIFRYQPEGPLSSALTITPLRALVDGTLAVWIFFVLSGYVLSRRFWRGQRTDWGSYAVRRAIRLYVPLWGSAVVAVVLLALRQSLGGVGSGVVDLDAAGTSVGHLVANLGLFGLDSAPINGVWWSMRWEVWFSALLPVILAALVAVGCGPRRRFRHTPLVFGVVCVGLIGLQPSVARYLDLPQIVGKFELYLPMFGVGVALAAYEDTIVRSRWWRYRYRGWSLLFLGLVLLGLRGPLGALRVDGTMSSPLANGLANTFGILGAGTIVALCVGWPTGIRALSTRAVDWVGTRSYSLYLVHLPLLHVLTVWFAMEAAPVWYVCTVVASSLVLAGVFYRFVEAPSIRLAARVTRPKPADVPVVDATPLPDLEPVRSHSPV